MKPASARRTHRALRAHRALFVVATCGAIVACNAIAGLNDEYSLSGDSGISLPGDKDGSSGGTDTSSGGGGDTGVDGNTIDSGKDAAKPPADASAPLDCLNAPGTEHGELLFCDNFEDAGGSPLNNFGWSGQLVSGGAPTVDAVIGRNGTRALHAKATTTTGVSVGTGLRKTVPLDFPLTSTYWLSFYFLAKGVGIDYAAVGVIQLATGGRANASEHGLGVYNNSIATQCFNDGGPPPCMNENDQSPGHKHDAFRAIHLETDRWYYAEVTVTRNANGAEYAGKVVVDGQLIKQQATAALLDGGPTGSPVDFIVGAFYSGTTNATTEVLIDDVVIRQMKP